jgi:hypothetical protein
MGDMLVTLIGLVGYLLPAPSLIWGWMRFWNSKPRFGLPVWRHIAAFVALIIASVVGLSVFFVASRANGFPEGPTKYSFAMAASRLGFEVSVLTFLLSLVGKGPARLPTSLAAIGLAALWIIAAFSY